MNWSNLDEPILNIGSKHAQFPWTLRNAYESIVCFGALGSGKTSGSGRTLALRLFQTGFGGLILTVKKDEKEAFTEYARLTGREKDLYILEEGGQHRFNLLDYLSNSANGGGSFTQNVVEVLKTVLKATTEGGTNDQFWQDSMEITLTHLIDLAKMAWGKVTIPLLHDLVQSLPMEGKEIDDSSVFATAFGKAREKILDSVRSFDASYSPEDLDALHEREAYEETLFKVYPEAREFKMMDSFFIETFAGLASKTRSIVIFTLNNFLFKLLKQPIYSLFCDGETTIRPELSAKGKIIIIHLPTKEYHAVGRMCQIAYKYIWQQAMERRPIKDNTPGVMLYADESHFVLHEKDMAFQTTARSQRICTIYLTQNLPNYYTFFGGNQGEYLVKGFLGTMGTHIYHCNNELETNRYASSLAGQMHQPEFGQSESFSENYSHSNSQNFRLSPILEPDYFKTLRTGGKVNNYEVDAVIICQQPIFEGFNVCKATFSQVWKPGKNTPKKSPLKSKS